MHAEGANVHATDPEAISRARAALPQITYHSDPYDALRDAEAVLICTECEQFSQLDWDRAGSLMARRLVIDGRNLCSPARMRELGYEYLSFGRELVRSPTGVGR
jgi:UDPglucose 6-dehydrogenase